MAVPDFQTIMRPLLQLAADQQEHSLRNAIEALAEQYALTKEERRELLPSGRARTFDNRVGWARTHLAKAGLLTSTRRGYFQITSRGLDVLAQEPDRVDMALLRQYPEYRLFLKPQNKDDDKDDGTVDVPGRSELQTPEEILESAYQRVRQDLASELLEMIGDCSPSFFEKLVVDLLVRMGYGGTRKEAGKAIGTTGDEGIDGIINEDRLGLDIVYIQAKRWQNTVTRPEIQKFAGALQGQRARKGIFLTTSSFSEGAKEYVSRIETKIVLIDGETLAQLMVDYGVGVSTAAAYEIKKIDADYFTEL
jgi:restriction system protein